MPDPTHNQPVTTLPTATLEQMAQNVLSYHSLGESEFTIEHHDPLIAALRYGSDEAVRRWVHDAWAHEPNPEEWMEILLSAAGHDPDADWARDWRPGIDSGD